nr:MAG TPA: polynucleotide kinase [Caudoviricetes sp.]
MRAILTIGCSGSGKTTWALQQDERIICRDNIRRELIGLRISENLWDNYHFDREVEVNNEVARQIKYAAQRKEDIIIADTNVSAKARNNLIELLEQHGYQVETKVFDTPIQVCLSNNQKRVDVVAENVIWNQWQSLNIQGFIKEDTIIEDNIIVCDIDGTVAKMNGRSPYDYTQVHTDLPRHAVIDAVLGLADQTGAMIVFVSGRKMDCRDITVKWLEKNVLVSTEFELFMRQFNDNRPDTVVKREIYDTFLKGKNVIAVFDDRPSVVDMWNDLGLTVFAVADQRNRF